MENRHKFNDRHPLQSRYSVRGKQDLQHRLKKIIDAYEKMVIPAIEKGLCGSIYTQVSDVEDEINGMMTYDREVLKVDGEKMQELAKKIYSCCP